MSYYTPLRVEADQKELIINQLKNQMYSLKKNQQDYLNLQDLFRKLDQKCKILQEEMVSQRFMKLLADNEFRGRHDVNIRNISQLKNQVDALKAELRDRHLELGDLTTDGNTLRTQLDQRNIQIQRLKTDINSFLADNEQLLAERARLDHQFNILKADKLKLFDTLKNLQCDNDSTRRKSLELQRYLSQVDSDGKILRQRIIRYENENNALDDEINKLNDTLANFDRQIIQQQKQLKQIQSDLASLQSINDKYKSQLNHFHKATQAEATKNSELAKSLTQAENALRGRDAKILEAGRTIRQLDLENQKLNDLNGRLDIDLQELLKHLQNLTLLNSHLVVELERYSAEDETVRALIDRKARVQRSRARVQELMAVSRATAAIASSPPKSRIVRRSKIMF